MTHTHQMESDTTTEEREVLLQRAMTALSGTDRHALSAVRDQLREHRDMYEGDQAMALIEETLRKLDEALGEESPDSYAYTENANQ